MKIDGPGSVRTNAPRRKNGADAAAGGDFAAQLGATSKTTTSAAVSGSPQIASVGALIALQESGDAPGGGQKEELDRAEDLLDRLDRIRVGILTGTISRADLTALVSRLEARRREGIEPRLASLIDEIETRAKVELAKLSLI